jgi:hypothetical protein
MTDFTMFSGDSKVLQTSLTDDTNAVVDITGAEITWQLSRKVTSPAILTKTVGSGITITNPANGQFEVAIDPVDTADLKGDYYHEIEMVLNGVVSTVLTGTVTIQPDLIRT